MRWWTWCPGWMEKGLQRCPWGVNVSLWSPPTPGRPCPLHGFGLREGIHKLRRPLLGSEGTGRAQGRSEAATVPVSPQTHKIRASDLKSSKPHAKNWIQPGLGLEPPQFLDSPGEEGGSDSLFSYPTPASFNSWTFFLSKKRAGRGIEGILEIVGSARRPARP
jgi:hypothetical protein